MLSREHFDNLFSRSQNMNLFNTVLPYKVGALCLVLNAFISETKGTRTNVALKKPTSRLGSGDGKYAVDGNMETCMEQHNPVVNPWWMVDLFEPHYIDDIYLYCGDFNCGDVVASVSTDKVTFDVFDDHPQERTDYYVFRRARLMLGRWVKFSRDVVGGLTFCEAEIMVDSADEISSDNDLINVAQGKPTSRRGEGDGEIAVDGSITDCMDIISQIDNPYWTVDLGYPYYIHHIELYCGENACGDITASVSLDNATFSVLDEQPDQVNNVYNFQPASPMLGRWVNLSREAHGNFDFCEVEVMSGQVLRSDSLHMKKIEGMVGTGPVLRTTNVASAILCAKLCTEEKLCVSANVITDVTSSTLPECQLLGSVARNLAVDTSTVYYEMSFE